MAAPFKMRGVIRILPRQADWSTGKFGRMGNLFLSGRLWGRGPFGLFGFDLIVKALHAGEHLLAALGVALDEIGFLLGVAVHVVKLEAGELLAGKEFKVAVAHGDLWA